MCGIALSLNGLSAMSAPGMGLMLAGAALALVLWQSGRPVTARIAILFLAGLALGQMRTDWRMDDRSAVPVIDTRDAAIPITGWLRAIERSGQGRTRLLIEVPVDVETGAPAHRIRVLADPGALVPGEWLTLDAVLAPPRPGARAVWGRPSSALWPDCGGISPNASGIVRRVALVHWRRPS